MAAEDSAGGHGRRKRRKHGGDPQAITSFRAALTRALNHVSRLKQEEHLLQVYGADGWKGARCGRLGDGLNSVIYIFRRLMLITSTVFRLKWPDGSNTIICVKSTIDVQETSY